MLYRNSLWYWYSYPKKYAHGFCFAVLCCGYTLTDFPKSIRLTSLALWQSNDCPSGNLKIAPVPAKQPWWIWINTSCEFIMNDCITTTKQSTTKPWAYFLGYTVCVGKVDFDFGMTWHAASVLGYRKTPSISRTKFENLNLSCILLQLSSLNPLKPGVKLIMKM